MTEKLITNIISNTTLQAICDQEKLTLAIQMISEVYVSQQNICNRTEYPFRLDDLRSIHNRLIKARHEIMDEIGMSHG